MNNILVTNQSQSNLITSLLAKLPTFDTKATLCLSGIMGITVLGGLAIVCFSGSSLSLGHGLLVIGYGNSEKT